MIVAAAAAVTHPAPPLSPIEVAGIVVAAVVGVAGFLGALAVIAKSVLWTYRFIRHKAFPWVKRAVKLVDELTGLPEEVADVKAKLTEHIEGADQKTDLLNEIAEGLGVVVAEVKNNGGGSLKDSTHRIERALGLPEPKKNPVTGPVKTHSTD